MESRGRIYLVGSAVLPRGGRVDLPVLNYNGDLPVRDPCLRYQE